MFHTVTDASKVAMMASVEWLRAAGVVLYDVQWTTPHLASMGVIDLQRHDYLRLLAEAVRM
jgi:leucyl/phenylalanyl-tRNA--protein transferase